MQVRIDELVRRHPLQSEVARLDAMIAGMRAAPSTVGVPVAPDTIGVVDSAMPAIVAGRRASARERLEQAQRSGLAGLASGRAETAEALLAARRLELEAEARRRLGEEERALREEADGRIRAEVDRVSGDLGLLRAARETLEAQLREGFLIAVPADVLEAQLVALSGARAEIREERGVRRVDVRFPAQVPGAGPRARLGAARAAIDRALAEIDAGLARTRDRVRREAGDRIGVLRKESDEAIDREMRALRERRRVDVEPILERQAVEVLLERTLAMEEAPARRVSDRPIPAFPVPGEWTRGGGATGPGRGRQELVAMRAALLARIRALVEARVADEAQKRRFRTTTKSEPGVPDRTEAFAQWLGDSAEL